ncbi:MAG: sugar ABC transporter substrate-binding protein, partial [Enterococcus hirae]|nr:sugar ABC transporter substrate-binding protein [Enterococcus hirae]
MKLWKKLAFTGVSAMMVGTLAACGSGTKEKAEASDSTTLQMYQIGDKPENFDQLMD